MQAKSDVQDLTGRIFAAHADNSRILEADKPADFNKKVPQSCPDCKRECTICYSVTNIARVISVIIALYLECQGFPST
jgi:hypothetical protein